MPVRRDLRLLVAVAMVAIVIVASWGWRRVSTPRAESPPSDGPENAAPDSPADSAGKTQAVEERQAEVALSASRGGHLALLEILGEADRSSGAACAICVSPDGTTLVCGHEYGSFRAWDIGSGAARLVRTFPAHEGRVVSLAWSPDGLRVASAGGDEIVLWDPWTGRASLRIARKVRTRHFDLAFSKDGSCLYTTAATGVDVWDVASGDKKRTLLGEGPALVTGPKAPIASGYLADVITVATDGSWLAGAIYDDPLQIIDTTSGRLVRRLPGLDKPVTDAVATSSGRLLAISGGTLRIWDTKTWEEVVSIKGPSGLVVPTEDGASVICTDPGAPVVTLWNLHTGTVLDLVEVGSKPLALALSGRTVWLGCEDGTARRYEHRP